MATVAAAVHHAHQQDVIHRDLKPANILVDATVSPNPRFRRRAHGRYRAVIRGRGHAQRSGQSSARCSMSEQAEGDPDHFDQRSDVYALGVILYKRGRARLPYRFAGGFIDAVNVIQGATPERLGDIDSRLRGDLERVVDRALAKERQHRYQTAQVFADDLQRVADGRPISVPGGTPSTRLRRWTMREENIRQAGGAGTVGYGLVALFELAWLVIGGLAWFWWPPFLPHDLRYGEFMINTVAWTVVLTSLARVNWRAAHAHGPSMWAALAANIALTALTVSVLFFNSYDFGGVMRDPLIRAAVFMLYTLLALLGVLLSSVALLTSRRLREWDRPVVAGAALPRCS